MLVLLDQTRLPAEEVELVCKDVPALVAAIRALAVRGAPLLGIAGGYGVALAAARGYDVAEAAAQLASARPTAVNLAHGVRRVESAYQAAIEEGAGAEGAAAAALAAGQGAARGGRRGQCAHGCSSAAGLLDELLPGAGLRLLTHCNTGMLVSGGQGTAFARGLGGAPGR